MTEENTLPENGWAILATRETKKHPKWETMLESINLLNAYIDNDAWVGVDDYLTSTIGKWNPNAMAPTILSMDEWCSMTGNEPTLEEEINALEAEFDPDKEIEVSKDGINWHTDQYTYIGQNGYRKNHVVYNTYGYHEYEFVRNSNYVTAGTLKPGQCMIVDDPKYPTFNNFILMLTDEGHMVCIRGTRGMESVGVCFSESHPIRGKKVNAKIEITDI